MVEPVVRKTRGPFQSFQVSESKDALTVDTLVEKMKGHPSTSGWDAMCSYDGNILNKILADQFKELHQISTVPMGSQEQPYRTSYTTFNVPHSVKGLTMIQVNYTFDLDLPKLQFSNTDSKALLTMPITSATQSGLSYTLIYASDPDQTAGAALKENTWYIRDNDSRQFFEKNQQDMLKDCWDEKKGAPKNPFPDNYYYKAANTDIIADFNHKVYVLSSIDPAFPFTTGAGNASDPFGGKSYWLQGRVPLASVAGNQIHPSGSVVTFDASQGKTDGQVILNFDITNGTGADFTLLNASGSTDMPTILKDAPTLLEDLKVYFSNALNAIQLRLAGVSEGKETPGHIPVKPRSFVFWAAQIGNSSVLSIYLNIEGSSTPNPAGRPSFQYNDGTQGLPIPQEYTGSLILSRDFLTRYYFLQAFSRVGFTGMNPVGDILSPISFTGCLHKPTRVEGRRLPVDLGIINISGVNEVKSSTFEMNDYQFTFKLESDKMTIFSPEVASAFITLTLNYHNPFFDRQESKAAKATISINKSIPLIEVQPDSDGFHLVFSITKDDYKVDSYSNIGELACTQDIRNNVEAEIKKEIKDIAPGITVNLPELQTLAIENMLFNGGTKFHLDTASKMYFPHDLLLLGQLINPPQIHQAKE